MSADRTDILPDTVDLKHFLSEPVLIAAVSGGSDSTALLLLLKQTIDAARAPTRLIAATVDHGLRPESADEAVAVGRLCADLAIPHRIIQWTGDKPKTALSATARLARHRLLADVATAEGSRIVLTGHTLDDQVETVVMRRLRGEGLGLAGIAPATLFDDRIWFVRPLLEIRRAALRSHLQRSGLGWIDDPSNQNDAFERPRIRKQLAASDGQSVFSDAVALSRQTGERRQDLAARAARLIDRHATLESDGGLKIAASIIGDADQDAVIQTLRILLAVTGGGEHLPDQSRVAELYERLSKESSRFSLARTIIDNRKGDILLWRENRGKDEGKVATFASPWSHFLPSFDLEPACAVARLIGIRLPPALPWP